MSSRRWAAAAALVLGVASLVLAVAVTVVRFPLGLVALGCLPVALAIAWHGVLRRGALRALLLAAAMLLAGAALVALIGEDPLLVVLAVLAVVAAVAAAHAAVRMHVELPAARRPEHPVLFYNPRSGGGKAERFHLEREARRRGIEPVALTPGTDLEVLVRDAVARGFDALAMAGGDGSQAIVAAIAAEEGLPYACIPAGTRNHFALDLGVDREDVVGALDALVDGGERVVDLADVNGRVFVNNVSLGLYAEAVQREGYRDAKLRTILDAMPAALSTNGTGNVLRFVDGEGHEHAGGAALLISNNRYRLGRPVGSGTRPRLDAGVLGVALVDPGAHPRPWEDWTAPSFDVEATGPVAAGIDGEKAQLEPPLRFRMHPHVLHVRIARAHPGASPSARQPEGAWAGARLLMGIVADPRDPGA
jgi:diacylglycerol kinase family enzyme